MALQLCSFSFPVVSNTIMEAMQMCDVGREITRLIFRVLKTCVEETTSKIFNFLA